MKRLDAEGVQLGGKGKFSSTEGYRSGDRGNSLKKQSQLGKLGSKFHGADRAKENRDSNISEGKLMTIQELIEKSYNNAAKLGWNDKPIYYVEQIALIHSEASEALESIRNHEPLIWNDKDKNNKPEGLLSEYADILIRIGHYVGNMVYSEIINADTFEKIIQEKLAYNLTRGYRHGGKKI